MKGRFAPSPTGRMHLGNVFAAMLSWHSAKSRGGTWLLRIEDLDPQRSKLEYAKQLEDDLHWLGLDWDEGGTADLGPHAPYSQSRRGDIYLQALEKLRALGLTYPCYCTRAELRTTEAPHASDGRLIYPGTCRPSQTGEGRETRGEEAAASNQRGEETAGSEMPRRGNDCGPTGGRTRQDACGALPSSNKANERLIVPDETITFTDTIYGPQSGNLALECGDFVVRRADGAWAYQLAVVVDDIAMGVTDIVRGCDLLPSTFQQLYLYRLLSNAQYNAQCTMHNAQCNPQSSLTTPQSPIPTYSHIPLLCNAAGQRLAKRDASLSLAELRKTHTPEEILGRLAFLAGMIPEEQPLAARELLAFPFPTFRNPQSDKALEKIIIAE